METLEQKLKKREAACAETDHLKRECAYTLSFIRGERIPIQANFIGGNLKAILYNNDRMVIAGHDIRYFNSDIDLTEAEKDKIRMKDLIENEEFIAQVNLREATYEFRGSNAKFNSRYQGGRKYHDGIKWHYNNPRDIHPIIAAGISMLEEAGAGIAERAQGYPELEGIAGLVHKSHYRRSWFRKIAPYYLDRVYKPRAGKKALKKFGITRDDLKHHNGAIMAICGEVPPECLLEGSIKPDDPICQSLALYIFDNGSRQRYLKEGLKEESGLPDRMNTLFSIHLNLVHPIPHFTYTEKDKLNDLRVSHIGSARMGDRHINEIINNSHILMGVTERIISDLERLAPLPLKPFFPELSKRK